MLERRRIATYRLDEKLARGSVSRGNHPYRLVDTVLGADAGDRAGREGWSIRGLRPRRRKGIGAEVDHRIKGLPVGTGKGTTK